jgi:hypothetical protein
VHLGLDGQPLSVHQQVTFSSFYFLAPVVAPLNHAFSTPDPEVVIHRLPGRKVFGEEAPGDATTEHVEDAVHHL